MSETARYSGVEELEEVARAFGWNIDYRQIRPGNFTAEFAHLERDGIYLASERFNTALHVQCEPPEGFFGVFLPRLDAGRSSTNRQAVEDGDIVVFPSKSELEFVTRGEIQNETVFLQENEFKAAARALVPSQALYTAGSAAIHHGDPRLLFSIRRDIDFMHSGGDLDSEAASKLLASIILWMDDASPTIGVENLANGARTAVAKRAQVFIEENFRRVIRMDELCTFCGIGLRSLQRYFLAYFQISPTDYIKARRMNAVRRELVKADPLHDQVTKIASSNGFAHLGRFSVDYRIYFGEPPSETLRRHG